MAREIGALGADEKEGAMKEEMLARLVAQAQGQVADMVTIRALIEEASDLGAGRALERLGLSDRGAEQVEMPGDKAKGGNHEDDQDFAMGALHGAPDRRGGRR